MKPLFEQSSQASKFAHLILLSIPSQQEKVFCFVLFFLTTEEAAAGNDPKT